MTDLDNIVTLKTAFAHMWKESLESDKVIATILYAKDDILVYKDIDKNDIDIYILNYNIFIDTPLQIYEIRSIIGKNIINNICSSKSDDKKNAFESYQKRFFDNDDYIYYDFNQSIFFWYRRNYLDDFRKLVENLIERLWRHVNVDDMLHAIKLNYKVTLLYI